MEAEPAICMMLVSLSKIGLKWQCTFRRCKETRRLPVVLQCFPGSDQRHVEHPYADLLTMLCEKQNPNARTLSLADLVRSGNWRNIYVSMHPTK